MKVFDKKWVMALGMALGLLVGSATVWGQPDQAAEDPYAHASAPPAPDPLSLEHNFFSFLPNVAVDPSGPYPSHQGTGSLWDNSAIQFASGGMASLLKRGEDTLIMDKAWFHLRDGLPY